MVEQGWQCGIAVRQSGGPPCAARNGSAWFGHEGARAEPCEELGRRAQAGAEAEGVSRVRMQNISQSCMVIEQSYDGLTLAQSHLTSSNGS